ncbi:Cobalt-zinc-cadmium resistance protein [Vibrio chagasii]|nr:Cobalt-zinc-cadmium resistance protein [Vibrio chagasii]
MDNIKDIKRLTWIGAIANAFLAGVKILAGKVTGSSALVADGVHSLSDLISDSVILVGANYWSQPADQDHRYGHGRIETMINGLLAISLMLVAVGLTYGAFFVDSEPSVAHLGQYGLPIVIGGLLIKEALYQWTYRKGVEIRSRTLIANAIHHRSDALSSLPVVIAIFLQIYAPSIPYVDEIATVIVSALIAKAAFDVGMPVVHELTERSFSSDKDIERKLQFIQLEFAEIKEMHGIRMRTMGSYKLVDLHILVDPEMSVHSAHDTSERFKMRVLGDDKLRVADIVIHIEPFNCDERLIYPCKECEI